MYSKDLKTTQSRCQFGAASARIRHGYGKLGAVEEVAQSELDAVLELTGVKLEVLLAAGLEIKVCDV